MNISKTTRRFALAMSLALVAALPVVSASPAAAAALSCQTLLSTTPGIEADLDGDENPDVRAPRVYDVTLCTDASFGYVTYPPTITQCNRVPGRCQAVRITILPAYASAYGAAELCASIEGGGRECVFADTGEWVWAQPRTICVGYDLDGGHPCGGSFLALE